MIEIMANTGAPIVIGFGLIILVYYLFTKLLWSNRE